MRPVLLALKPIEEHFSVLLRYKLPTFTSPNACHSNLTRRSHNLALLIYQNIYSGVSSLVALAS